MKRRKEIEVVINFTEGWEERVTKAAYNLYLRVEAERLWTSLEQKGA